MDNELTLRDAIKIRKDLVKIFLFDIFYNSMLALGNEVVNIPWSNIVVRKKIEANSDYEYIEDKFKD